MNDQVLAVAAETARWTVLAWALVSALSRAGVGLLTGRRWVQTLRREFRPFVLPVGILAYLARVWVERAGHPWLNTGAILSLLGAVLMWWADRHDDDDRWKRRRRKVTARVQAAGHRLVVVGAR